MKIATALVRPPLKLRWSLLGAVLLARLATGAPLEQTATPHSSLAIEGVDVAPTWRVGNKTLGLVGAGVRTRFMFHVYVAALYAEKPISSYVEWRRQPTIAHLTLTLLVDLKQREITSAFRSGVVRALGADAQAALHILEPFFAILRDARRGETISLTFEPTGELRVLTTRGEERRIGHSEAAFALLPVFIGDNAVDEDLRAGLLGMTRNRGSSSHQEQSTVP